MIHDRTLMIRYERWP